MHYIVFDLEFNQPYQFHKGKSTPLVPSCPFEIIQIGAVKLNDSFQTIDQFNLFIEPKIYPRLHPFVQKLTGIKNQQLKNQPSFPTALQLFVDFCGNPNDVIFCTWGNDDIKSFFRNVLYYKLNEKCISHQYINVQKMASKFLNYSSGNVIGLKNATEQLNVELNLPFHNALHDAIYTAQIFDILQMQEFHPIVFLPNSLLEPKVRLPKTNVPQLYQHFKELFHVDELSSEQKKLIRTSYFLGRKHTFDIAIPTTEISNKKNHSQETPSKKSKSKK